MTAELRAAIRPTEPLRAEHRELLPHIEYLRTLADRVGRSPDPGLRSGVSDAYTFLTHVLIPHALAEDEVLYPEVARILGHPAATATMRRDHAAVVELIDQLGVLRRNADEPEQAADLRRVLYGLHALVSVHFTKEEEIYLPLLDKELSPQEAGDLFAAMERAAGRAKATVPPG